MIINNNISSINSSRVANMQSRNLHSEMEKLSSGLRINKAGDDASGLAISEKMRAQIKGMKMAIRNANDAISFIQTAEGHLQETHNILSRIRELSVQSANGIYTKEDRLNLQVEVSQLKAEIDRIAFQASFNGLKVLTGAFAQPLGESTPTNSMYFQVGANPGDRINAYIGTMTLKGLKVDNASLSTLASSDQSIATIDEALKKVSKQRADLGAYQNRMDHVVSSLEIATQNIQAAESQIRDADIASTMVDFIKDQILNQSSIAMLAQANNKNQAVLRLFN